LEIIGRNLDLLLPAHVRDHHRRLLSNFADDNQTSQLMGDRALFTAKGLGKRAGLGLSMVYGFARLSSGDLEITSEIGRGTTIRLLFPAGNADQIQTLVTPTTKRAWLGKTASMLVVEDDEAVRYATTARCWKKRAPR
jgi:hypothetical protein